MLWDLFYRSNVYLQSFRQSFDLDEASWWHISDPPRSFTWPQLCVTEWMKQRRRLAQPHPKSLTPQPHSLHSNKHKYLTFAALKHFQCSVLCVNQSCVLTCSLCWSSTMWPNSADHCSSVYRCIVTSDPWFHGISVILLCLLLDVRRRLQFEVCVPGRT